MRGKEAKLVLRVQFCRPASDYGETCQRPHRPWNSPGVLPNLQSGALIAGAVPGFEAALDAVRHRHKRWDGMSYPSGLRGDEIPLTARLMADAYSARPAASLGEGG